MINIMMLASVSILASCQDDEFTEPTKDWDTFTEYFASPDVNGFDTYFKPSVGYVGDPMPMYDSNAREYKIYYLQDYRPNPVGTFHPIYVTSTEDGATYSLSGEAVPTGGIDEQDAAIGTGSITLKDGKFYCYYTGEKYKPTSSQNKQVVMRAFSEDGITWKKDRVFMLKGTDFGYDRNDFRDPQIFKTDDGTYHMIISTRKSGKGTIAEFTSSDLMNWTHTGDFMNMQWDRFYECPDVFKMGNYWYLVYNDQTSFMRMPQYFKGTSLDDLKSCTANDAGRWPDYREGKLDGKGIYAVKTASDGTERFA
ncbi:MAG: glycosyl hydrolase, partial [Bacteroidales bacterium]|nr:glycosyl hydrolase [Bacteroidales bacterium]